MKIRLPLALIAIILIAGCVQSPEFLAKSDPLVKEFLEKYPNATVKITFFSKSQAQNIIESVKETCGNPYMEAKDFYIISIVDRESNLAVGAVLDWNNKTVECAVKMTAETPSKSLPTMPEQPPTEETPIETPTPTPTPAPIGACTSCDDSDKCTFDYCNEFTNFECKHKTMEPCYNNNICEYEETTLPEGPSCPNLGWVAPSRGVRASPSQPVVSAGQGSGSVSQPTSKIAEQGYGDYVSQTNSGQNNDCPATCDDDNTNTSDYYDFDGQKCKHYNCVGDVTPPEITIIEPANNSVIESDTIIFKFRVNEKSRCGYLMDTSSPQSTFAPADFEDSIRFSSLKDGPHYLQFWCYDDAENLKGLTLKYIIQASPTASPTPALYPKWEQDNVSITPTSLDSGGGTIEAVIATQDSGSPAIASVTFTLTKPDGTTEAKTATDTCATAIHTGYTSKCWKVTFNIPANNFDSVQTYMVKVSNSNIQGTKSGSFTADAYSSSPIITLAYATGKYINNSVIFYKSRSFAVETNINSTCSYSMNVSNATSSQDFPTKQMITADKKYHGDNLENLRPSSAYNIYVTCTYLQYSSNTFVTFKTNSTLEEEPGFFTT